MLSLWPLRRAPWLEDARNMARRKKGRDISGILLIDKSAGMGSNATLQRIKHLYQARKAGHTGSLDRPASGLLPICLGQATKVSSYLLEASKHYQVTIQLGVVTTTGDAAGEILEVKPVPSFDEQRIAAVLRKFTGAIEQIPPMYSALKHQGRRLYELAYQGEEVERKPRPVTIYNIKLMGYDDAGLAVRVECSKGTYIRTLAEDIGCELGCGAHADNLRRFGVANFDVKDAINLDSLAQLARVDPQSLDQRLLPVDAALQDKPEFFLGAEACVEIKNGQSVCIADAPKPGLVRIYNKDHVFIGIGRVTDDGRIYPHRLIS